MSGAVLAATPANDKIKWLEGLRGIAAMQVILLHYASVFFPVFAHVGGTARGAWEAGFAASPWFFLIDGYSAVYLFFLMSGFVLAPSFRRSHLAIHRQILKRFLRLFLPAVAACILSIALMLCFSGTRWTAAHSLSSDFVSYNYLNPLTLKSTLQDMLFGSMVFGYQDYSIFQPIGFTKALLAPISQSLDGPLWTIHIELWGSLLVLALVTIRNYIGVAAYWITSAVSLMLFGSNQMMLFVIGCAAFFLCQGFVFPWPKLKTAYGAVLLIAGIYICGVKNIAGLEKLFSLLLRITFLHGRNNFYWQSECGALLIFFGALLCLPIQSLLSARPIQMLGKLSFSLYLIHFPILFTISLAVFELFTSEDFAFAVVMTTLTGILVTLGGGWLFEKYIDQNAIRLARSAVTNLSARNHRF